MVNGYTTTYDGFNVTNTHTPGKTIVTVTKVWKDSDNKDGIRPNDVTIKLLADGTDTGKTITLSKGNNWKGSFNNLDEYKDGKKIVYTVEEESIEGYTVVITGDAQTGFTVTNSHTPADNPVVVVPEQDIPQAPVNPPDSPVVVVPEQDIPQASVPQTGDSTNIGLLFALAGISLIGVAAMVFGTNRLGRRKR